MKTQSAPGTQSGEDLSRLALLLALPIAILLALVSDILGISLSKD